MQNNPTNYTSPLKDPSQYSNMPPKDQKEEKRDRLRVVLMIFAGLSLASILLFQYVLKGYYFDFLDSTNVFNQVRFYSSEILMGGVIFVIWAIFTLLRRSFKMAKNSVSSPDFSTQKYVFMGLAVLIMVNLIIVAVYTLIYFGSLFESGSWKYFLNQFQ